MRYDPRADVVFRKIFGEHKNLCMSLLNALLPLGEDERIVSIEYGPLDVYPESPDGKNSIVDVRCTDSQGRNFIVEMQMFWTESFLKRTLFNASKAYAGQASRGFRFRDLEPVYCLCLLNENMPDTREYRDEYLHTYLIQHERHSELTIGGMKFVFVELKKFHSSNRAHNKLADLWLRFLTMGEDAPADRVTGEMGGDSDVNQAIELLERMSLSTTEKYLYDKFWDNVSCERTLLSERFDQGMTLGMEKGEAIGMEKGEAIGLEKGRMNEKYDMARNMKALGYSLSEIAKITQLPIPDIEKL